MYAVGIDSGTQGTKVLLVEFHSGEVHGRGYAPHAMVGDLPAGASEQHPRVWIHALEEALLSALREAKIDPQRVVSLGVSGQQHGFVALDRDGVPIRPAKLWNDTSTLEETDLIVGRLGGKKKFIRMLGISLAVGYTASKILWLKRKEPKNYKKLASVLLPHDYLNFHLTGTARMEYGDASGTGLMDVLNRRWHKKAIAAIDPLLEGKLPVLCHPQDPVGYLRADIVQSYGMKRVLVSSGGGDNMMGAIGTGNVSPGVCSVSLGTSGTIYSYFERPFIDPEGEIAAFCDSTGGWLPLLCTMNVTNTTELLKSVLQISNEELEGLAVQAPPGAGGLIFLPFLNGERVPVLPQASGVVFGLDRKNLGRPHLARAFMEGTIFNLGYGFSRMRALGLRPSEIRATGGGAHSKLWLQILADVLGTPVVTLKEQEAAAYGAAIQSMWSLYRERGEEVSIAEIVRDKVKKDRLAAEPKRDNAAIYRDLQKRFNSLWKSLQEEFKLHKKLL